VAGAFSVTREIDLRQRPDFDYGERLEADYLADDRYWGEQDRLDRHTEAPDVQWFCKAHGWHRHILGCPECKERKAA
jgi:hypothetical protein